jgi:DcmR-like sensory protein
MATVEQPVHVGRQTLGSERHICAFFNSPEEEYRVIAPFIRDGIERGEKAFHIVDPRLMEDHLARLQ